MAKSETMYKFLKMLGINREVKEAIETKGKFDATGVGDFDVPNEVPDGAKRLSEGLENLVHSEIIDLDKRVAAMNLAYDLQQKGIEQISLSAVGQMYGARIELCTNIGYTACINVPNVNGMLPKVQRRLDKFRAKYNSGKYAPRAIRIN